MNAITPILRRYAPLALLLTACVAMCSCTETRFASPPGEQLQSCDPRWEGLWIPGPEPDSGSAISVDAACALVMIDVPRNGEPTKRTPISVRFLHADDKDYVVVSDDALKAAVDIEPVYGIEPVPTPAYFVARYVFDQDRIRVHDIDSERVATLIIAGKLEGTVSKTANNLHVFVTGDAAHILEVVRDDSIFDAKPNLELERSELSVEEFERRAVQQRDVRAAAGGASDRPGQKPRQ